MILWIAVGSALIAVAVWLATATGKVCALVVSGVLYDLRSKRVPCLKALDRAVEIKPDLYPLRRMRGDLLLRFGFCAQALDDSDRAIALNPRDGTNHELRGRVLLAMDEHPPALEAFDAAIELEPDNADHHYFRGATLLRLGQPEDALLSFERGVTHAPRDADLQCMRAVALWHLDRNEEALIGLERARSLAPDDGDIHFYMGKVLVELGRLPDALMALHRAVYLEDDSLHRHARAEVLIELGRPDEALADLNVALRHTPNELDLREARLDLLESMGHYREAYEETERIVRIQSGERELTALDDEFRREFDLDNVYQPRPDRPRGGRLPWLRALLAGDRTR